jgi:RecJ-like exonuclease
MSFEEMQSVLQGILLSQQQLQLSQQQFQIEMVELKVLTNSNSRAIQAMLDNAATDRLEEKERTKQHEERMQRLENLSEGLVNLTVSINEDRPTILRLLQSNNSKLDLLLDLLPPQQQ